MNNKRGSIGGRIALVLILMLLAAGGGAYGYRILDGKMAVRDAGKVLKHIEVSDYDTDEATIVQGYIDDAKKNLEVAKSRKDVYEILDEFNDDLAKVQTKAEKELAAARKEAEEARNANQNNNNDNQDSSANNGNNANSGSNGNSSEGGYKSNNLTGGTDDTEESGGILSNLFGGNSNSDD